jgi:hypothetical protein
MQESLERKEGDEIKSGDITCEEAMFKAGA